MRNYQNLDSYLTQLSKDIYPQPEDDGHSGLARKVIDKWMSRLPDCKTVLDVGCGNGFAQGMFEKWGADYQGVAFGDDYIAGHDLGRKVDLADYSFLPYGDDIFDLVFSRHSLEHSPMPLLTLMEWHRVSKQWLGLVVPSVEWYGFKGRNHYYVLYHDQWINLMQCSGWKMIWSEFDEVPPNDRIPDQKKIHEYWFFCEKVRK